MSPLIVIVCCFCACVQGLSPPGPMMGSPDFKGVITTAQKSLRKIFLEMQVAAKNVVLKAREILHTASKLANTTLVELQTPLTELMSTVKATIKRTKEIGVNVSSCVSGQEESARHVLNETSDNIVGCVTSEIKRAVNLSTSMFGAAASANNMLTNAPREFLACLPSLVPTVEEIVNVPACIGLEITTIADEAQKIVRTLGSHLADGRSFVGNLPENLRECVSDQLATGRKMIEKIDQSISSCVQNVVGIDKDK